MKGEIMGNYPFTAPSSLTLDPLAANITSVAGAKSAGAIGKAADSGHAHDMTHGSATLVAGTANVNTTAVTANSLILLSVQPGVLPLALPYVANRNPGAGFTITSLNALDTCTIGWAIVG